MSQEKPKIIVILGPTASGKSALAVRIARAFKGEVISADSRQVYKGLDLGSGKITEKEMKGIPHHLLDVANPKRAFTVAQYKKLGEQAIQEIISRKKIPIICGGSAFYIQALVDGIVFPEVPPNKKLRAELEKKSTAQLCTILKKLDSRRFADIDTNNRHRLVRAIEISKTLGSVPKIKKVRGPYDFLFIGTMLDDIELKKKIKKRLLDRIDQGMIDEVKYLRKNGLSWKRLESFGLEYRAIAYFLQKKITKEEMISSLEKNIWDFTKRQKTWFKKDTRIQWFDPRDWGGVRKKIISSL